MEGSIIEEYILMDHWEAENIESTLAAIRPYLLHRQTVARNYRKYSKIDFDIWLTAVRNCNNEILNILSIPNNPQIQNQ